MKYIVKVYIILIVLLSACAPQLRAITGVCNVSTSSQLRSAIGSSSDCNNVIVQPGDYHSYLYWFYASDVDLHCAEIDACKISAMIIVGDNNRVAGFDISDKDQKSVRTYGNYNIFELNQVHDMAEDGMWIWGKGNIIRNNYFHDLWWETAVGESWDNHVDFAMTWAWSPRSGVVLAEDILIENNIIDLNRTSGSNQLFIVTVRTSDGPVRPARFTFRDNVFICRDGGYCPIAIYDSPPGFVVTGNNFYNTSNNGSSAVYGSVATCTNNKVYGYSSMGCSGSGNSVQSFQGLPDIVWPPGDVATQTPTFTPVPQTVTKTMTATLEPTSTATVTPTLTPTATLVPTETPKPDLCIMVVWDKPLHMRPGPTMFNDANYLTSLGNGFIFIPLDTATNYQGTFYKVAEPDWWVAGELFYRPDDVYTVPVECR